MAYTILIADDEAEIRQLLRLYLEKDGYEVMEAENGVEAMEILRQREIHLILFDIMMPQLDDYITKPFNPLEAMARINAGIRRFYHLGAGQQMQRQIHVKDLTLDTEACALYRDGKPIALTSVEYKLMKLFMEHPGKVFTKQQLYEEGWGEDFIVADNNIMVCISKLRGKLSDDHDAYIKTIRGLGYRMEKDEM